MKLEDTITTVQDFPKKGVQFKDITSLVENPEAFRQAIDEMAEICKEMGAEVIVGAEARGFILGAPIAYKLGLGFVPLRKPGKLPRENASYTYELEYGTDTLCITKDSIKKGTKFVLVDDIVALGGTMDAGKHLIEQLGGELVGMVALMGLTALPGVKRLEKDNLKCVIYDDVKDE